jgi:hypothetical protein
MMDFPCYFLWRSLVLNSNGKLARCLIYQNVSQYANLNEVSVLSAYNHPSVQHARELFRKPDPTGPAPSPCAGCSYFARHHGAPVTDRRTPLTVIQPGQTPAIPTETVPAPAPAREERPVLV